MRDTKGITPATFKWRSQVFRKLYLALATVSALSLGLFLYTGVFAQGDPSRETDVRKIKDPNAYGTVLMDRLTRDSATTKPVLFPHWVHRMKYNCTVCHNELKVPLKARTQDLKHSEMDSGKHCGVCHDGKSTFATNSEKDCFRCHSYGIEVKDKKQIETELKEFPKDDYGHYNWASAIRSSLIKPHSSLDGKKQLKVIEDTTIIPVTKFDPAPPDVLFPHKVHTMQMDCVICHPSPFKDKNGENPEMNMMKIISGQYCGTCHGKVSFPLSECFRCHSQPAPIPVRADDKKDEKKDDKPAEKK